MAETKASHGESVEIPEWEQNAREAHKYSTNDARSQRSPFAVLVAKCDAVLPPHRKYLGMSRKLFLWVLFGIIVALLGLIIGLAVGLTQGKSGGAKNLPLPSNSLSFVGDLTFYQPGLGACGYSNGDNDNIAAISQDVFDAAGSSSSTGGNSNQNPLCGLMLRASRYNDEAGESQSVDLKVVDRCTGCQPDDLDTSLGAFEKLAPSAAGRVDVTWAWLQPTGS
ncbi:hypothetical protein K431DRAFT_237783 [Polychaeton citri CBS 116435]|uniref:RlpA-like protein double-psi beta-barrel domain-containing protein n=1 Tax=Polychaeton citri CBS 116435 TaxID=1314669 RepID=A0A9P4QGA9_9PEZI|nr:hypothetical protein K431DRAFT_237783 [Polychaeton citri CBS 116435]